MYIRWPRRTIMLRTNELLRRTDVPPAAHERAAAAHGCTCCGARTSCCGARMYLLLRTNELLRRTDVPAAAHERAAAAHGCTCCGSGLSRLAMPDYFQSTTNYAGLLPVYYGPLGRTQGFQYPSGGPAWASGKLSTRLPISPVSAWFTSTVAGLGRESLIYNGGGSSLCRSEANALRPVDPN